MRGVRRRYDKRAGAAYLYLGDPEERTSQQTVEPPNPSGADDYLALDFDATGRLVGIEFLVPGDRLLRSTLEEAEQTP
jgi:uncharacterized protein YuzE